jgi:hypothetical protein
MPSSRHAATGKRITLYVPGLLSGGAAPPALVRLLARADRLDGGGDPGERQFAPFGVAREPGRDLPVAAVTRIVDAGVIDREWWIRADPVYLEARRDSLVLHAGLGLRRDEAEQLATELDESLALDGWLLKAPVPERWYLKPPAEAAITTTPLSEAVGRNVHPLLPQGPDRPVWHSRLNELQILLHTSSVNAAREARGELPANSVWFWGGGRLPRVTADIWGAVYAHDPVSVGLARLAGTPAQPVPPDGAALLAGLTAGAALVVLEPPGETLERFCMLWLAPLLAAVHGDGISALTVVSDYGPGFRYVRRHRWRVWRRGRPLSEWRGRAA